MRCHYEVLEVPRDADESEIKSAYRKLALKWHPDKNLENSDDAKEQFQIVQQAYEVLSDRQERAWYDNHREQILRGSNSDFEDKSLDIFQYFTASCYKGYGDSDDSFYTVYRNVFEKLANEDMDYMENKEEFCEIPNFGNSATDFEKVSEFYAYWLNYNTKKSYVWLDPYDIKDIRDRRYLKLVEKENKKVRQKAKKERNEEVRNLVAFVKKRDKRVEAQKKFQEQKLLEDKKKRESLSKQKRLERQQELTKAGSQPEWAKFDNVKSELEDIERKLAEQFGEEISNSEEEEEEDFSDLYCVACSKLFKTPKAFENHESSKKHRENVEVMKTAMLEENEAELTEEVDSDENKSLNELTEESNGDISDVDSIEEKSNVKKKKKKKKKQTITSVEETEKDQDVFLEVNSDNENIDFSTNKKQKRKNKKTKNKNDTPQGAQDLEINLDDMFVVTPKTKKDKKIKEKTTNGVQEIDTDHNCVTCKSNFSSKNKLFDHLKKTGHGVYIPASVKNKTKKNTLKNT